MNKIPLVIQREYLTRVKKPSFWVLTIVVPLLLAAVYAIPIILASRPLEHAHVLVADDTGLFQGQFRSGRDITYHEAGSIDYARRELQQHVVVRPRRERRHLQRHLPVGRWRLHQARQGELQNRRGEAVCPGGQGRLCQKVR